MRATSKHDWPVLVGSERIGKQGTDAPSTGATEGMDSHSSGTSIWPRGKELAPWNGISVPEVSSSCWRCRPRSRSLPRPSPGAGRADELIAGVTYFVSGLVISEVFFGWATEEDLQPNIDGLSFDEVLLLGLLAGVIVVAAAWIIAGRRHPTRPAP